MAASQALRLLTGEAKTPLEAGELLRNVVVARFPELAGPAARFTRSDWGSVDELAEEVFATAELRGPLGLKSSRLLRERWQSTQDFLEEFYGAAANL